MFTLRYMHKAIDVVLRFIVSKLQWIITLCKFKLNGVKITRGDILSYGIPIMAISLHGKVSIGRHFMMNNGHFYNMIGRQQPCFFVVSKTGELIIGDNVGISATAIVCQNRIEIENNVRIGGGTVLYDTDFHSLNYKERIARPEIHDNVKTAPILIKENVFIGAHCTILKGVTIGMNSVIGACSVVAKDVPDNEVWAGNPARFIRKLEY